MRAHLFSQAVEKRLIELQQQALPAREAHASSKRPAQTGASEARCRRSHRSSAARRDVGQQGDVGPSGSGAGASQHRAVGGPQHVVRRPERAGLPGWREGTRYTLPLDRAASLLPSAPPPSRASTHQRAPGRRSCPRPSPSRTARRCRARGTRPSSPRACSRGPPRRARPGQRTCRAKGGCQVRAGSAHTPGRRTSCPKSRRPAARTGGAAQ